jgi:hypothetical protein
MEKETMLTELTTKDVHLTTVNKNIEILTRAKEGLLKEVQDLRNELSKSKLVDHDTKNVSIQLNERLHSQHTALEDIRELLLKEQKRSSKISQDLNE